MHIVLARHGQTAFNAANRFQGTQDIPLNERGKRQAKMLAPLIIQFKPQKLYTSDLTRSIETAQPTAELLQLTPIITPVFREFSWGILEGFTWAEASKHYPDIFPKLRPTLRDIEAPKQEPATEFHERIKVGLALLLDDKTIDSVALIGHGYYLNGFVMEFLGLDFNGPWPFSFTSAAVTVLEVKNGRRRLLRFNEECHLQGDCDD